MIKKRIHCVLVFMLLGFWLKSQDMKQSKAIDASYRKAYQIAYEGNLNSSKEILKKILAENPNNIEARALLASTYSWSNQYDKARVEFNKITSLEKQNDVIWISAIKNELYANNNATALGLINKALIHLKENKEIIRLKALTLKRIKNKKHPKLGWHNVNSPLKTGKSNKKTKKNQTIKEEKKDTLSTPKVTIKPKTPVDKEVLNNRVAIRNSFTVFSQRYDPMIYSSVSFKRQTLAGSIIPRINYSNRLAKHGIQYEFDFYPKFSKRFYAYINYGYSSSSIYPNHKLGGDLYVNLPGAMEFSAGGRFINFDTKNVSVITNSLGHYRGNYYFSLRSYITPRPDNLTRVSGNILVRKYLKDAENYMGVNVGMGFSPELRQLMSGDELLAETLLYIESQRLSFEYQFTGKKNPNIYKANMGITRQEIASDSGNYFWSFSAGFTYMVKF